jgi:anti-anti-sigma factor
MTISAIVNFTQTLQDGVLVLEVKGAIESALSLEPMIEAATNSAAPNVVIVLNGVDYINSSGFGALIRFSDAVTNAKKNLFVVGLQGKVHVVFNALGAHSVLNILPTLNDAMSRIQAAKK